MWAKSLARPPPHEGAGHPGSNQAKKCSQDEPHHERSNETIHQKFGRPLHRRVCGERQEASCAEIMAALDLCECDEGEDHHVTDSRADEGPKLVFPKQYGGADRKPSVKSERRRTATIHPEPDSPPDLSGACVFRLEPLPQREDALL